MKGQVEIGYLTKTKLLKCLDQFCDNCACRNLPWTYYLEETEMKSHYVCQILRVSEKS